MRTIPVVLGSAFLRASDDAKRARVNRSAPGGAGRHRARLALCAKAAERGEAMILDLWGLGIGWVDARLMASALLSNCQLWTLDGSLAREAAAAGVKLYRPA